MQSKKWGTFHLCNLLFKIYFHLDQLNLCTNLVRAMEAALRFLPPIQRFPAAERCCYGFYSGRFHLILERFKEADDALTEAYNLVISCPQSLPSDKNRKLILHYLLPARIMAKGHRPSKTLFPMYNDAISFLSLGNISALRGWIEGNTVPLLRLGTYMTWQRLVVLLAIPQLIKRVFGIYCTLSNNPTRLPLPLITCSSLGAFEADEMLCLTINAVARKSIRGYISDEKQTLVLANNNPFPPFSTLQQQ